MNRGQRSELQRPIGLDTRDRIKILSSKYYAHGMLSVPVSLDFRQLLLATGEIGGVSVKAIIDTGAQRTIGNLALRDALYARARELDSAALVGVQPGAPGTPANETTSPQAPATQDASTTARPSASAKRNDDAVARQRTETASRPRRPANADAIATQRLIERDLGTLSSSPSRAPDAPLDRDALATQRLIERDLGPFLHRNDRGATGRTYPAIN